jgi:hypothetical protein
MLRWWAFGRLLQHTPRAVARSSERDGLAPYWKRPSHAGSGIIVVLVGLLCICHPLISRSPVWRACHRPGSSCGAGQRLLVAYNLLELESPLPEGLLEKPRRLLRFITTGDPARLEAMLPQLLGEKAPVESLTWKADKHLSP